MHRGHYLPGSILVIVLDGALRWPDHLIDQ